MTIRLLVPDFLESDDPEAAHLESYAVRVEAAASSSSFASVAFLLVVDALEPAHARRT
jgi:hypothetical protein